MESDSDYSFPENENDKYKIDHLKRHLTNEVTNIRLISRNEILLFQKREIELYTINNQDKINKKYTIQINSIIKDILIRKNELIVSTNRGIIIFGKTKENKYIEIKRIKPQNNEIYYSLLDLEDNNLIAAFSLSFLNIIDIKTSNIISYFKFNENKKGIKMVYNDDENKERMVIKKVKEILNVESFDPRARPFLIKQKGNKNYLICFKLVSYCVVLHYKKMKIIKKFDFTNNFGFHIFKPDNEYDFFYILLIDSYKNPNFIVQKYDSDLKLIEQFKNTSFNFPNWNPFVEEGMQDDASSGTLICEDECIYRTIVKDIKNFSFLYHKYVGAPVFIEYFILIHCVMENFKKISNCI